VRIIDADGRTLDRAVQPLDDATIRFVSLTRNPFHHPAVMWRRRVLLDHALEFDERFQANQDFELWSRLLPVTRAANLPQALLDYRVHGNNISVVRLAEQQRTSIDFCRARQRAEGVAPLAPETLYGIFDAIHGSRIVGRERADDAAGAIGEFLDLAVGHARTRAARRWAAALVLRALLLGRARSARVALAARALRLSALAPVELVSANAEAALRRLWRAVRP
jgi:hypothetical protein